MVFKEGWNSVKSDRRRSILADPRNENVKKQLNLRIKFRESFRPFAPAVLEKYCASWFNLNSKSPYMLFVADINEKSNKKKLFSNHYQL